MDFHLELYPWKGGEDLLFYSSSLGCKMLRDFKPKVNIVEETWSNLLLLVGKYMA
jgi:hypothetical protein